MPLNAGDIGFVEVSMASSFTDQNFKIVVLQDVSAGESISFTDNGVNNGGFSTLEGVLNWTNDTGGTIAAGTVIEFSTPSGSGGWSASQGSLVENGVFDIGTGSDDQILAQSGGSPIAQFHSQSAFSINLIGNSTINTELGSGLTEGTNAIAANTGANLASYTGPTSLTDPATWAARLNDPSNWTQNTTFGSSTISVTCFLEGTLILTDSGDVAVETISIGDTVITAEGAPASVKWIGRQTVSTAFGPAERLMPVRISAGALGNGLPHTDLTVTADHGMLVDGVICHAGALVNGTTITQVPLAEMGESYTVYHIETKEHEIILANGAPAETFIDNVSRRVFDNYAEFEALYGDVPEMEELPYPRAMSARQVPQRITAKLAEKVVA
ncbi:Hint domain-containing protein [Nioella sp. MMSF_3534]|uniref:Hint domain-containing protein n=1 Tax=Nioella sp. MMSF_3534 TaxID=3046720 RepID=UPI00273F645D|nr:Hint domain-containing protein [Nioella sp. MMSF_3534]